MNTRLRDDSQAGRFRASKKPHDVSAFGKVLERCTACESIDDKTKYVGKGRYLCGFCGVEFDGSTLVPTKPAEVDKSVIPDASSQNGNGKHDDSHVAEHVEPVDATPELPADDSRQPADKRLILTHDRLASDYLTAIGFDAQHMDDVEPKQWRVGFRNVVMLVNGDDVNQVEMNKIARRLAFDGGASSVAIVGVSGGRIGQTVHELINTWGADDVIEAMDAAARPAERRADDDPVLIAADYLERRRRPDGPTLVRHQGEWLDCSVGVYQPVGGDQIRSEVARTVDRYLQEKINPNVKDDSQLRKVTSRRVSDVLMMIEAAATIPDAIQAPAWLDGDGPNPANEYISMSNGLVHLPTAVMGKPALIPWTPRFYTRNRLPFAWSDDAPEPVAWLRFLGQIHPDDSQAVESIQKWFGYVLSGRTDLQKIMCFIGRTRSGKGTVLRVLEAIIGEANRAPSTLHSLSQQFGLAELIGKCLSIISDARLAHDSAALAALVERLLSISGEDTMRVDRKYLPAWIGRMLTRFMIVSNEMPEMPDSSAAVVGRLTVVKFGQSFLGKEDIHLFKDKLTPEMPSIMRWAVDGLRLLERDGALTQPDSGKALITISRDMASPISLFVKECCERSADDATTVEDMFAAWQSWCFRNGCKPEGGSPVMARKLVAAVKWIEPAKQSRDKLDGTRRYRAFRGVRLRRP